jgi:hypothetical protein
MFFEVLTTLALAICNGHKEGDFVFRKEKSSGLLSTHEYKVVPVRRTEV